MTPMPKVGQRVISIWSDKDWIQKDDTGTVIDVSTNDENKSYWCITILLDRPIGSQGNIYRNTWIYDTFVQVWKFLKEKPTLIEGLTYDQVWDNLAEDED